MPIPIKKKSRPTAEQMADFMQRCYPDTVPSNSTHVDRMPIPVRRPASFDDMIDALNFSGYVSLSEEQEQEFDRWLKAAEDKLGLSLDVPYYDMKAFWKNSGMADDVFHEGFKFPDKFKKPSHPTFTRKSIYDGRDGQHGGDLGITEYGTYWYAPDLNLSPDDFYDRMRKSAGWLEKANDPHNIQYYMP